MFSLRQTIRKGDFYIEYYVEIQFQKARDVFPGYRHALATGSVSAQLYWSGGDDHDGYRVDSVIAELYKNGMPTGMTADLNATNGWSATWTDLDVHYGAGTDVEYSVRVEAPSGYSATYEPEVTTVEANETV